MVCEQDEYTSGQSYVQVSSYLFPGEEGDDGDAADAEDEQLTAADSDAIMTSILGPCMLCEIRQHNT